MKHISTIETSRLKMYPASKEEMEALITSAEIDVLKIAYQEMLDKAMAHPDEWKWYSIWMIELNDGTHIGELCFKGVINNSTEIGYGINDEFQNKGYATEAVKAVASWALNQPEVSCITAESEEDNIPSIRVLKKVGFKPTGKYGEEGMLFSLCAKTAILYIHGKGGNSDESEHYKTLFTNCDIIGFDYKAETPRDAKKEFSDYFDKLTKDYNKIIIIASSIGAYFALCSLSDKNITKAYFISPIVDMEMLIKDMMLWVNVTEEELEKQGRITTDFGETLSWEYLTWVKKHTIDWKIPTKILYGENDSLQSIDTIKAFANKNNVNLTVMPNGEHWFHTEKQMAFLDKWIKGG